MDATRSSLTVETSDGVGLHVTDTGEGIPILFLHEYAGDERSWSGQVDMLVDSFRCITFAARGYLPSDVPRESSSYSWERAVADVIDVLDALDVDRAHVVGLSMGSYTALQVGLRHPERVRSILAASAGSGSDPSVRESYLAETRLVADQLRDRGPEVLGRMTAEGPSRIQLKHHNEPAWHEFIAQFAEHSVDGLALTILEIQGRRPSLHDFADDFARMDLPLLVVNGDEDSACLSTGMLLKDVAPACGMLILPNSGHVPNLERPAEFSGIVREFVETVERDAWPTRDPRSRFHSQFGFDQPAPANEVAG